MPALTPEGQTQVVVGLGQVRLQADSLPEAVQRLVFPALVQEGQAQVVVGLGQVRLQVDRLAEAEHGLGCTALVQEGSAQVVADAGGVRLEAQRLLEAGHGLLEPALLRVAGGPAHGGGPGRRAGRAWRRSSQAAASSCRPRPRRAFPRLALAGWKFGCSSTAWRKLASASSSRPCTARAVPRLLWASG